MQLAEQVVSLELAKKLKELGVKQESYFCWHWAGIEGEYADLITSDGQTTPYLYSAFTVAELGEMLPFNGWNGWAYEDYDGKRGFTCKVSKCPCEVKTCKANNLSENFEYADTEADARAKMLCYLIENKLINPK